MLYNRIQESLCHSYWDMTQCRDLEVVVVVEQEALAEQEQVVEHVLHQDLFK